MRENLSRNEEELSHFPHKCRRYPSPPTLVCATFEEEIVTVMTILCNTIFIFTRKAPMLWFILS